MGVNIDEEHYTESDIPFQLKPYFSALGSIIEISPQGPMVSFVFDDSFRSFLGFDETILFKEFFLSPYPVDILSFNNNFPQCDFAKGMILKQKRSGIFHIWTMTANPGYKYVESIAGVFAWYMMETKMLFQVILSK